MIVTLAAVLFACALTQHEVPPTPSRSPGPAANSALVGVWELTRFDNLLPADADGAYSTVYVAFHAGGKLRFWFPGRSEAEERPYALDGVRYTGWLGLTNDLTGRGTVTFPTSKRFELVYPDGSIASFRRLSTDPVFSFERRFQCLPITVRGHTYDPSRVADLKTRTDRFGAPESTPSLLLGSWVDHDATVLFQFGADSLSVRRCEIRSPLAEPKPARSGRLSVHGGYLVAEVLDCGSPIAFEVSATALTLRLAPSEDVLLTRVKPETLADVCP